MKLYYLRSDDDYVFLQPLVCEIVNKIKKSNKSFLLMKVLSPLSGIEFKKDLIKINYLYLGPLFISDIFKIRKLKRFPIHVRVYLPENLNDQLQFTDIKKMECISWATLYDKLN